MGLRQEKRPSDSSCKLSSDRSAGERDTVYGPRCVLAETGALTVAEPSSDSYFGSKRLRSSKGEREAMADCLSSAQECLIGETVEPTVDLMNHLNDDFLCSQQQNWRNHETR
jgi:hypothetical protein